MTPLARIVTLAGVLAGIVLVPASAARAASPAAPPHSVNYGQYAVTIQGTVGGYAFAPQAGILVVGKDAGANSLDFCLTTSASFGPPGTINLGTNQECFRTGYRDTASVSIDPSGPVNIQFYNAVQQGLGTNSFGTGNNDGGEFVYQGAMALAFHDGGASVSGSVDVSGQSPTSGNTYRYVATFSGSGSCTCFAAANATATAQAQPAPTSVPVQSAPPASTPLPVQSAPPASTPVPTTGQVLAPASVRADFVRLVRSLVPVLRPCVQSQSALIATLKAFVRRRGTTRGVARAAYGAGLRCSVAGSRLASVPVATRLFRNTHAAWFAIDVLLYTAAWAHLGTGLNQYLRGTHSSALVTQIRAFAGLIRAASINAVAQYRAVLDGSARPRAMPKAPGQSAGPRTMTSSLSAVGVRERPAAVPQAVAHDLEPSTLDQQTLDYYASLCTVYPYYTYPVCGQIQQEEEALRQRALAQYQQQADPFQNVDPTTLDAQTLSYDASLCQVFPYYTYARCQQITAEAARREQQAEAQLAQQESASNQSLLALIQQDTPTLSQYLAGHLNFAFGPANATYGVMNANDAAGGYMQLILNGGGTTGGGGQ